MSVNENEKDKDSNRTEVLLGITLSELEELDDEEFQIPQLENIPTLESILDEDATLEKEASPFLTNIVALSTMDTEELYTGMSDAQKQGSDEEDVKEDQSAMARLPAQWIKDPPLPVVLEDPVLQSSVLRGVSAQILSALGRIEGGTATCMAVCGFIAVGTSTGQLLIFDSNQVLKLCLGSHVLGAQHGAISALGFNSDASCILGGFAKGEILHWDLESGKLLRSISNVIPVGNAVVSIKFTSEPTVAVCSDSAGSVFEIYFKRTFGAKTWESRCLLSGDKEPVRCMAPLRLREEFGGHPVAQHLPLAAVTVRKLLIVCQKPDLRVVYASSLLKACAGCVPSIGWRFLQCGSSFDPVLTFCHGSSLSLYQVTFVSEDLKVLKLRDYKFSFEILNFKWLSSSTMMVLDTAERVHAIDRKIGEELQVLDNLHLVTSVSHPLGDQVAMPRSMEMPMKCGQAIYQSVCSHKGKVFLLGNKVVYLVSLKTWEERLDYLVKHERYVDAFALAWMFHEGSAKAVLGLAGEKQRRIDVVVSKVADMLMAYLHLSLRRCPNQGKIEVMERHFQETLPLCVTCCIKFNITDLLFGAVYEKLSDDGMALGVLFQCLQPHICANRLTSIPPLVMKDMVGHYADLGMTHLLDTLIPKLEVRTLDLHQVVSLSRQHKLTDALIHVFNKGMNDYTSPIQELISSMANTAQAGMTDDQMIVGNKILVYISCCLSGQTYPFGALPSDIVHTVRTEVFTCLMSVQAKDIEAEGPYPYVRTLLKYNTKEFLNVLALAFEDLKDRQAIEFRQRIIDILLQVMLESTDFSPSQIGSLFTFLARQLAKADDSLFVNHQLFHQALNFLCNPEDTTQHAERQQALLELLQAGGAAYFEESQLLSMAESVHFYQVCEFLYKEKNLYHRTLACLLKDPAKKDETLQYLHNILASVDLTENERVLLKNEVISNLKELVILNQRQTSSLLLRYFLNSIPDVMETLHQDQKILFDFLHGVFNPRVDPWPFKEASLLDHSYHERYLDLLCQRHPDWVVDFIKLSDMYRPEEAVEITRRHNVHSALAYLLEMQGNTREAFSVLMECLRLNLENLIPPSIAMSAGKQREKNEFLQTIHSMLYNLLAFCQRVSRTLDNKQRQDLWFPLLEFLMSPAEHMQGPLPVEIDQDVKDFTKEVIKSMTSCVPLMDILQHLLQDPGLNVGKFVDVKPIIFGIIDEYVYEKTLMEAICSLFSQDLHWSLCSLRSVVARGLSPAYTRCNICTQRCGWRPASGAKVFVFSCGHIYHHGCLQRSLAQQEGQTQDWACLKCQSPKKHWMPIMPHREISSQISMLTELTRKSSRESWKQRADIFQTEHASILEQPDFKLNLAPPP